MHCSCDNLNSTLNTPPGLAPVLPSGKIVAGRGVLSTNTAMKTIQERFWAKVDKSGGDDACWNWVGSKRHGYGQFWDGKKPAIATRFIWQKINGEIPSNFYVCHSCDNPSCVNPRHLWLGTHGDNVRDMFKKKRWSSESSRRTHCPHGHEYTKENTGFNKCWSGTLTRRCKQCDRDKSKRLYRKNKEKSL